MCGIIHYLSILGVVYNRKLICCLSLFLFFEPEKGTVRLVFQPAEEGGAGAYHMINEGALGDAEAIFGMHVDFKRPTGSIGTSPGPILAAVSFFEAKIEGKGGHAAEPHATVDPILAASFAIVALQQLISREVDPLHSQVCSLCLIRSIHLWFTHTQRHTDT